jgi:hypothetical protein
MTKKFIVSFFLFVGLVSLNTGYAQIGIDTDTPDPSSALDINSTSAGFLAPRMTRAQMNNIPNPAEGLIVICTDCNGNGCINVFFNGSWECVGLDSKNPVGTYDYSVVEPLVSTFPDFSSVDVSALISTGDILPTYDGNIFRIAGAADGAGAVINSDGNIALIVNFESHYAVGRLILDPQTLKPIQGDYMLNSSVSDYASQCSGTMWESAIHGGAEDFFISASEYFHHTPKRIDIEEIPNPSDSSDNFTAFGRFNWENALPLPAVAYPGKTVIIGGDDDRTDSKGQIIQYYSDAGDADLNGGSVYVLKRVGANAIENEEDLAFGTEYDVEFVEIPNGASLTKGEMEQACINANAFQFIRAEDLDYGKGSPGANRTVYFSVTGTNNTSNNWGAGYKLVLDPANPLVGTLTQIISGNTDTNNMDGNMPLLSSPDNVCVTENYIYWQEDPTTFSRGHQAYIWQTDLNGNNAKPVMQINKPSITSNFSGEFGALIDITDKVTNPDTSIFVLCLQPNYWSNNSFKGIDGHVLTDFTQHDGVFDGLTNSQESNLGSQILILKGLPR